LLRREEISDEPRDSKVEKKNPRTGITSRKS